MTTGSRTAAGANVLLGWLGFPVPPMSRQRNATRAGYRKTERRELAPRLIQRLEAGGCAPRQVGPGQWIAACPSCRAAGHRAVAEIRRAADGTLVMACVEAHERRSAA